MSQKKQFQRLILTLGESAPFLQISFRVRNTKIAQRWAKCVHEAIQHGGIRERTRFCNFNQDAEQELQSNIKAIKDIVVELKKHHPEIDFGSVNFEHVQREVNRLHVNFADRHLVATDITSATGPLWTEFNSRLHQMEAIFRRQRAEERVGIKNADLTLTFTSRNSLDLSKEDFDDAVLFKTSGVCYLEYSQVGRHFLELLQSEDTELPAKHIQPFRKMSADSYFWFGHSQGHSHAREFQERIKEWFYTSKLSFQNLGFRWNLGELGIGYIPVASLEEPLYSSREIKRLQDQIANKQYVYDIQLE